MPDSQPTGALWGTGATSCVQGYSPAAVAGRSFAFDGTVTSIGPGRTDRPGKGRLNSVSATFSVSEWFAGGSGATVTIDMPPPGGGHVILEEGPPPYQVGSRLLVSGEPRWGGAPLSDPIAWGCGFSRYFDKATADSWRAATR